MELSYPAPDVIAPASSQKQAATVILLHGLGDTSAGWKPLGMQMREALPHVKWIFPTAPMVRQHGVYACGPMPLLFTQHISDSHAVDLLFHRRSFVSRNEC